MCDSFCDWCEQTWDKLAKYGGIALSIMTHVLIYYGIWAANKLCIFYWFGTTSFDEQIIKGIPL